MQKPVIGVSSCLLGENVRFNGGHKRSHWVTDDLTQQFAFQPFCPEVAASMGTPRPAIRLVNREHGIRAEFSTPQQGGESDVTDKLRLSSETIAGTLIDVDGILLTQKSPSCGLMGVKLYHPNGNPVGSTRGLFADVLSQRFPHLPIEDSGRLNDDVLRENFVLRVLIHHDWRRSVLPAVSAKAVLDFHTRHKFTVMAHSLQAYKDLGRLLANWARNEADVTADTYFASLMQALKIPANRKRHANVLQHLQGYVKRFISPGERKALSEAIDHYRLGHVPLIVPVTLLRCFAQTHAEQASYLNQQSYLQPHPLALRLRNGI